MVAFTTSITPSSATAVAFSPSDKRLMPTKDGFDAAFRYEKSRPRARTTTTVMKGHHSRLSTSTFSKSSIRSGKVNAAEGGQKMINTSRASAAGLPAGPKSASSRISLERFRREQVKDGHAGHVSRQSSSTSSTPSSTSSSNPANAATHANKLPNGRVQHQPVVNGIIPRSSVSGNTTTASRPDQLSHTSSSGGSADIIKAACNTTSTSSSTTPRRVHIAPLRLVNSNATAGREGLHSSSSTSRARSATNTLPSSTIWSIGASSGTLSTSTNGPLTGPTYQTSYSHRFEKQPSTALPPISLSAYPSSYIPVNPIPTSASSYPVQYAFQQQRNPSTTPPMSYQQAGGDSIQVTIAPRRTSDYTVMQVVHPHYAYSRPMAPLPPASTSTMTGGGTAMSPRFSSGGLTHSQSVPASWNSGGYASRTNYEPGMTLPPRVGGGWPAFSAEHSPQYKSPYPPNSATGTHFIPPPSSPAYRFPLSSSTSASMIPLPWYTPMELSHQYDSMRGSLKRKASLGLVDMHSASRRRSSGESGGSRRGSRSGADKLPPVIPRRAGDHSPRVSTYETSVRVQRDEILERIVPKIEEEDHEDGAFSADPLCPVVSAERTQELETAREQSVSSEGNGFVINADDVEVGDDGREGLVGSTISTSLQPNLDKAEKQAGDNHTPSSPLRNSASHPSSLSFPRHNRALSAVLEAVFEHELTDSRGLSNINASAVSDQHPEAAPSRRNGEEEEQEERETRPQFRRAQSLPLPDTLTTTRHYSTDVTMSTAGDGSEGTGSSGGRRGGGGSPYKRASRSLGPSSAHAKRRGSVSAAGAAATASGSRLHNPHGQQQQHQTHFGSNAASSPISFLGLPSPTTPIEAASLQRSFELREEQRRIIDERRRLAALTENDETIVGSPSMSSDTTPAQPTSARSTEESDEDGHQHNEGHDARMAGSSSHSGLTASTSRIPVPIPIAPAPMARSPRLAEGIERPSSRLATRRGYAAQEKVANLKVSTPSQQSDPRHTPAATTAPLHRSTTQTHSTSRPHHYHSHSHSHHQLGSPALFTRQRLDESLPFPRFSTTNVPSASAASPRLPPPSTPATMQYDQATGAGPTPSELPSNYRSHRRATISQTQDAMPDMPSHTFQGFASIPPSRGLASSVYPSHHRAPPQAGAGAGAGAPQRHHIPPMQPHLHTAPLQGISYSNVHVHPHHPAGPMPVAPRPAGGRLSSPSAGDRPSKQAFLSMFKQFYDSMPDTVALKTQLETLLHTAETNIGKEVEAERYRRADWEKRMDERFEDFRRTLSSEMLLLERRIQKMEDKGSGGGRRIEGLMSPSDPLRSSRKRSIEDVESDELYSGSGKGKRRFTTPPELDNLTKRVEVLEAHASSASSGGSETSPRQQARGAPGPSTQEDASRLDEVPYTSTFRPVSSLRGT